MKLIGVIRSRGPQAIEVEAASYEEARIAVDQRVPDGWELQHIRQEKQ